MLAKLHIILLFVLLMLSHGVLAQFNASNLRTKQIITEGVIKIDSLKIVPNSLIISEIDTSYYSFNYATGVLTWKKNSTLKIATVRYRVFSFPFSSAVRRYKYDSIQNNFIAQPFVFNRNEKSNTSLFERNSNIQYNGSFGRTISVGNNQDAVFNSQLNLQISGLIGDSIQLAAAITDNNIPIQPDGTTQQLNEFDKILLQFKKKNWQIDLGDIDIRQQQYYFLNFYKRLQGASYQSFNQKNKFLVSGAIAKGKFVRNVFQGQEGNQGPYRLQGSNNEFYMIVLAGTEKVFIDGEQMQRGEDQDYVINYNTGEITFTQKRMITKDKRIQVEFEYADRNYLNSMLFVSNETTINKKLSINIAAYTNADSKNSTINQSLNTEQKQFLANLGDDIQNAFYKTGVLDSFSTSKILYAKRVNPVNASWDSIYVYSTNKDSAKYSVSFTEVGANKGNYIPYFNGANGKVYQFIAPVNGVPQGNFEAAYYLVTPKKQQIVTLNSIYNINRKTILTTDIALSSYDVNTFSTKDKGNNNGYAAKFVLSRKDELRNKQQLNSLISYEFVDEKFKPIERLRAVEFARDWGLSILTNTVTEHLPKASVEWRNDSKASFFKYNIDGYLRSDGFNAVRNNFSIASQQTDKLIKYKWDAASAINTTPIGKGNFLKSYGEVLIGNTKQFKQQIGMVSGYENNQQKISLTDTLTPLSYSFNDMGVFVKNSEASKNTWRLQYTSRTNQLPQKNKLQASDKSDNYNFNASFVKNEKHKFLFNITYRELKVLNSSLSNLKNDKSLLGRVEYYVNEWNGFLTGSTLYETGAGQEQKRDFSYIEVPAGRGEYTWNDYNADGIPQLNEFEIALYPDQAKYIRVFTPTNQFVKANYIQLNYNISLQPRAISNKIQNKNLRNFITRFSLQSSMQNSKKVLSSGSPLFNPFQQNIEDTSLISANQNYSNTISFNRFSNKWGVEISNIKNENKALLTYGFESRQTNDYTIRARVSLKKMYTLELIQKTGTNNLSTPKFSNRNYSLKWLSVEPKLTYTYLTKYRIMASYIYTNKTNDLQFGGEKATTNSLSSEIKYNTVNNTSLLAKFTYSNIQFNGATNTTISYLMLDGLLPGKNYLWTIELTKRLGNNLELTFNYEGRKPESTKIIHIGRVGIRALL